jgi:tetratricopeptide (TPR) repeat protein
MEGLSIGPAECSRHCFRHGFMNESTIPFQSSPPLQGERVSFTGTLASMTHRQAAELVAENGGEATGHISKQTTMLVVGEEGWPLEEDGQPSVKLQQAHEASTLGQPLRIIRESEWLRLLDLEKISRDVNRLHTPAMLQQLLGIPVGVVRRWERLGLIKAEQRVFRLPYFDYQQVSSVRKLHELLQAGVSKQQIESSLGSLASVFPSLDEPLAQLEILARDSVLAFRDRVGLVEIRSGQRLMEFDAVEMFELKEEPSGGQTVAEEGGLEPALNMVPEEQPVAKLDARDDKTTHSATVAFNIPVDELKDQAHWSAADWFEHGSKLLEQNHVDSAIEALRMAVMDDPDDPEMQFHLADALVRSNNLAGALERYYVTVALDADYVEAWTQLGCVQHLLGDASAAIDAFDIALATHEDYSVAVYHKALVLHEQQKTEAAHELFERYLQQETLGPWAEHAREILTGVIPSR